MLFSRSEYKLLGDRYIGAVATIHIHARIRRCSVLREHVLVPSSVHISAGEKDLD